MPKNIANVWNNGNEKLSISLVIPIDFKLSIIFEVKEHTVPACNKILNNSVELKKRDNVSDIDR